jgi:hypothetical protein
LSQGAQEIATTSTPHLSRSLGLWAIVGLGLGYMTPMTVFDTFGIVSGETNAVVPLAYLAALVAMIFTAISYGRMTRVYPSAGSEPRPPSPPWSPQEPRVDVRQELWNAAPRRRMTGRVG